MPFVLPDIKVRYLNLFGIDFLNRQILDGKFYTFAADNGFYPKFVMLSHRGYDSLCKDLVTTPSHTIAPYRGGYLQTYRSVPVFRCNSDLVKCYKCEEKAIDCLATANTLLPCCGHHYVEARMLEKLDKAIA